MKAHRAPSRVIGIKIEVHRWPMFCPAAERPFGSFVLPCWSARKLTRNLGHGDLCNPRGTRPDRSTPSRPTSPICVPEIKR